MKVVLLKRVPKLGNEHDVVNVKPGFARNFLIPQSLAKPATENQIAIAEKIKAERKATIVAKLEGAQEISDKLKTLTLTFKKKARGDADDAKLYGSVAEKDIVDALVAHGIELTKEQVKMDEHIKALGESKVILHLAEGHDASVKVKVERE